jgi:hypothetical protein
VALFNVLVFLFGQIKLATYIYCIFIHKAIAWATCVITSKFRDLTSCLVQKSSTPAIQRRDLLRRKKLVIISFTHEKIKLHMKTYQATLARVYDVRCLIQCTHLIARVYITSGYTCNQLARHILCKCR